jgi:SP family general alpha glucoside:H+ symporter-like MFS transporter
MLQPWPNDQESDSLDSGSPTASYPQAASGSTSGKTGITPQQAWREMPLPEFPGIDAVPMEALGTSISRPDRAMDMLWIPRSSSLSDDTPQKIRRGFFAEKNMVFLTCCQQYPKAIGWSLLLFLTVVMEGYDKSLITGFFAFPAFRRNYGQPTMSTGSPSDYEGYEILPQWQTGLQNAAIACEIIGLLVHGHITYIVGYRKVMIGSLLWLCLAVFPAVFAKSIKVLLVSQALSGTEHSFIHCASRSHPMHSYLHISNSEAGIPWGVIQTLAATYAAEVVPSGLRPYVLSNINLCWVAGQLLGSGVLRALIYNTSEWSYRLPFALQWAWAVPLLIGVWFAPESPCENLLPWPLPGCVYALF